MKNPYRSTSANTVYYEEGTKGTAGYAIPVPKVTKYDGKLYFTAKRETVFSLY